MHVVLGLLGVRVGELHGSLSQAQVQLANAPPAVGEAISNAAVHPSVCLSVCLSHASSSTVVHFRAMLTTEH